MGEFRLSIIILILATAAFLPPASQATTITVGPAGCDYESIQAAIDVASHGDTVEVQGGTYRENVNVNKSLTLKGIGMPVVDAGGVGSAITLSADGIWLEGFVATNASSFSSTHSGIRVISNDNMIRGNNADNNSHSIGIGIWMSSNNTIEDNRACSNYYGILQHSSSNNTIKGNNASNKYYGVYLLKSNNNIIEDNNATGNNYFGIRLEKSSNNTLIRNKAGDNNDYGIILEESYNNTMKLNLMSNNFYNFKAGGDNDIDTSNLVDGKPIYYLVGASNKIIDSSSNAGVVYCMDCENIVVRDLTLKNNRYGIYFQNICNSKIENNSVIDSFCGIHLSSSWNNTIEDNDISDNNDSGIYLLNSDNNTIRGSNIIGNHYFGIYLLDSSNNSIEGNNAIGNHYYGISLAGSCSNTIEGNNASNNNEYGISLDSSINNTMKLNLMSNNRYNFKAEGENNIDTSNLVDGKPVYYLVGASGGTIDSSSDAGVVCCIDCENITIRGLTFKNNMYGIYLHNTCNSVIQKNDASENYNGIFIWESNNNTIAENNASNNNEYGISLDSSVNNTMKRNLMSNNRYNFEARGENDIDTSNLVDGKSIYYLVASYDKVIDSSSDAGVVYCIHCENITVRYLTLKNNRYGIYFHNTSNSRIENNNVIDNLCSILLSSSSNNIVKSNNVSNNKEYGIYLYYSNNSTIEDNNASDNNDYGIILCYSGNNNIEGNSASDNNEYGIYLHSSSNNTLFMNKLSNNKIYNASDNNINRWDNGTFGNYYGDFNCTDSDGDGICVSAYAIPGGESVDRYPLARWPWEQT